MKEAIGKTGKWKYYCDRCGKEISFKDKTLNKLNKQYSERNSKKITDLCNDCCAKLEKNIEKRKDKVN